MFENYDYVELIEDIDAILLAGTRGAIVMVYPSNPPEFEVEFVNEQGDTLSFCTVRESQIRKIMQNKEVTKSRGQFS